MRNGMKWAALGGGVFVVCLAVYVAHEARRRAEANEQQPRGATARKVDVVAASNAFGFDLFQQLRRRTPGGNVFVSPLSVSLALSMAAGGAAGETRQAMMRTLRLEGASAEEADRGPAGLLAALKSADPMVELAIANSLWARAGVRFEPDFLTRNRRFFGAEISALDFNAPSSVAAINRWVAAGTRGKIARIVEQIPPDHVLLLINAVYFKGQWQTRFDRALTRPQPFHLAGGGQKRTPMMEQSGNYPYLGGDRFQAIGLPYGNGRVSLHLVLPAPDSSLDELLRGLNAARWDAWMNGLQLMPGDVRLPRFSLAYERALNDALREMGMEPAFNPARADFSRMRAARDLFLSEVKHQALIELNEDGTEAAAATSVGVGITSVGPQPQRFTFTADRPFLLTIRDSQTGALLFLGALIEPQ
jgi:serine protease inhibitor